MTSVSILSPGSLAHEVKRLPVDPIRAYYAQYNIDVERFFQGITSIVILRCSMTGLTYYQNPASLAGDGAYYAQLELAQANTYYPLWRWSHEQAFGIIPSGSCVLEIGAGGLGFMNALVKRGDRVTGLEINPASLSRAKEQGLDVIGEDIQQHASANPEKYDVVCFFEVLEHIADPLSFLTAVEKSLKPGGLMIFSVPNNFSYLGKLTHFMNMPPHHVILWDPRSVLSLTSILGVRHIKTIYEPLLESQVNGFLFTKDIGFTKIPIVGAIYLRTGLRKLLLQLVTRLRHKIHGQTMLAVFQKKP